MSESLLLIVDFTKNVVSFRTSEGADDWASEQLVVRAPDRALVLVVDKVKPRQKFPAGLWITFSDLPRQL